MSEKLMYSTRPASLSATGMATSRAARAVALLALATTAALASRPAQATVLEQKWVAGQQLSYDLKMDGTLSMMSDAATPLPVAGVPLEIKVNGAGLVSLDTRAVAADGTGLVAVLVPRLQLNGETWGQKILFDIKDGTAQFSFNGQKGAGKGMDARALIEPTVALQISRLGRLQGVVPLPSKADAGGAQPNGAPKDKTGGAMPNPGTLLPAALLQALPQLWPGRDIKVGEKWTVEPQLPIPAQAQPAGAAPGGNAAVDAAKFTLVSLGKIDMTLLREEQIEGRPMQRIGVRGTLGLDKDNAARLTRGAGNAPDGNDRSGSQQLTNARQIVDGDIWFDAALGQITRVSLKLHGQFAQAGVAPPKNPAKDKAKAWKAAQEFEGTLQMQLRPVLQAGQNPTGNAAVGNAG